MDLIYYFLVNCFIFFKLFIIDRYILGKNTKDSLLVWDMIIIIGNYAFDSFPGKLISF